ncbi:nuclear transport factor 2 family protein [Microbulbifer epialgicus]|uniref:Nuclear transport factor 2 family protein n=1 Tax=Microbulbifer epialgicus TaxID=393907 RepID=A0ABV4P000_9GAMM
MLKIISQIALFGLSCFSLATLAEQHPVTPGPKVSQELIDQIIAADRVLFDAVFNNCNLTSSKNLVTEDFEMYHDKWGKTASSGAEFLQGITNMCERRKDGSDINARRELIIDSVKIYPLNHYGAIQTGTHIFYGIYDDKMEVLRESGQFTHLWKKVNGEWKLSRVLSFDHQPAVQPSKQ